MKYLKLMDLKATLKDTKDFISFLQENCKKSEILHQKNQAYIHNYNDFTVLSDLQIEQFELINLNICNLHKIAYFKNCFNSLSFTQDNTDLKAYKFLTSRYIELSKLSLKSLASIQKELDDVYTDFLDFYDDFCEDKAELDDMGGV